MVSNLVRKIGKTYLNVASWHTRRKIVVIESDDWGSIRMPSVEAYNKLLKKGYHVDRDPYSRFDSLESEDDLVNLFEVLSNYRDSNGNCAVITANSVVANPDFEKIKQNNFERYFYEPVGQTFKSYPNHFNCYQLWHEGLAKRLFYPQFHGREHLNVSLWLKALQGGRKSAHDAFNLGLFALNTNDTIGIRQNYMAAFDYYSNEHEGALNAIVEDGLAMFEEMFKYKSASFIAPCYTWGPNLEATLATLGVKYIQGIAKQKVPPSNLQRYGYDFKVHHCGQRNRFDQYYVVRNCFFEPSQSEKLWGMDACLKGIRNAFTWNTPAIISTHRVNFVGFLNKKNRDNSLASLNQLLKTIIKRWPDVEFMTSVQLGTLIENDRRKKK